MKVLVASQAVDGHFNPMTGIAKHLQLSGHDVRWYTGVTLAPRVERLGMRFYPFVRAVEHTADNLTELYPKRRRLKGPLAVRFDADAIMVSNVGHFFADIKEIRDDFPFDVLLLEGSVYVQRLVKELLGVPVVSVIAISNMERDPWVPPLFMGLKPATSWRGRVRDRMLTRFSDLLILGLGNRHYLQILADHGIQAPKGTILTEEPYVMSDVVVQTGTESFDYPRSRTNPRVRYVGPLLPHRSGQRAAAAVDWSGEFERTVVVTQGTVDNVDQDQLIIPTIEALKDAGTRTRLLVATGGSGTEELRRRYPQENVVVEDYLDFDEVLDHTDVYVTNGGFGGVLQSLVHGVPLVCAGIKAGRNDIAAHVDHHGVGIDLRTEAPTAAAIRAAVDRVITEPSFRRRAAEFREEMRTLVPHETVREVVEGLAQARASTSSAVDSEPGGAT
jgi:MGT family glycosyltransferase